MGRIPDEWLRKGRRLWSKVLVGGIRGGRGLASIVCVSGGRLYHELRGPYFSAARGGNSLALLSGGGRSPLRQNLED